MGKERVDVIKKMSVPVGDAARREDKDSLFGFSRSGGGGCGCGRGLFGAAGFGEGFVDGCHCTGLLDGLWLTGCNSQVLRL